MKQTTRYLVLSFFLLLGSSFASRLHAQFYAVQIDAVKAATATFNVEGSMLVSEHWTLHLGGSYNPWTFREDKKVKHLLIRPGARYWFWQTYAGSFISMYGMTGLYNTAWGGKYRYEGWGGGAGVSYGRAWLLGKRWNLEIEGGLGLFITRYTKYRCGNCGEKLDTGTFYLPSPKAALNLVYLF